MKKTNQKRIFFASIALMALPGLSYADGSKLFKIHVSLEERRVEREEDFGPSSHYSIKTINLDSETEGDLQKIKVALFGSSEKDHKCGGQAIVQLENRLNALASDGKLKHALDSHTNACGSGFDLSGMQLIAHVSMGPNYTKDAFGRTSKDLVADQSSVVFQVARKGKTFPLTVTGKDSVLYSTATDNAGCVDVPKAVGLINTDGIRDQLIQEISADSLSCSPSEDQSKSKSASPSGAPSDDDFDTGSHGTAGAAN